MTRAHVIGMGRLGAHLAHRLEELDIEVTRWNRTPLNGARALSEWTGEDQPDAVFLAVSDDALASLTKSLSGRLDPNTWLVHHAGSVSRDVLNAAGCQTAVLWPPMTFQQSSAPDWPSLPLVVDTDHDPIRSWARTLTPNCTDVHGDQRKELHLAAVLLGNLTAGWIGAVQEHLRLRGLDANALSPLVSTSVQKALNSAALDTVTGPAARNDKATLLLQAELLNAHDAVGDLASIHHILTNRILTHHGHDPLPPLQAEARRN